MEHENLREITETDIMQMLHKKKMYLIERCFQEKEKGLAKDEFIKVMLEYLDYDKSSKEEHLSVTLALIELFKEIDVNGDGTMEWEEFSNHIIELGLQRNDRGFKNLIKTYQPSYKTIDKEKHQNSLEIIQYVDKLRCLFSVEKESSRFKVYEVNNGNLTYEVNAHKGSILALEYLSNQNLLATSSNDLTINFWDASNFALKQMVSVPEIQLCMKYADWKSSGSQLLYTGGSDSIIHIYDATTLKEKGIMTGWNPFFKNDSEQTGHSSPVGDILPIDSQQTLVTAGYDGNICLWDAVTHLPKKQLRGHDKGVYSLDWCDWSPMNQCLLSAGLDHEAFIWNTYVKEKIFLLRGHNHPLVGVKCVPETPQIVTADISGMVKVWDVRTFLCMQTFNVPVEQLSTFCLTYSTNPAVNVKKRIVCAYKKMLYFQYDQPKDQLLTDEKICIRIIFNKTLLCFITLHPDCLKVWSAREGTLQGVYRGLSNYELTAMVLDYRQRKLFVGDSDGNIFTVNIKNGVRMKSFEKHETMVTGLCHWTTDNHNEFGEVEKSHDQRRLIISISKKNYVNIHDEDSPEDALSSIRYIMRQHKDACNSVAIKAGSDILASASDDGTAILTNLITYRQEILPNPDGNEIKRLLFLGRHNVLVVADSYGHLLFYGVGQTAYKNKLFLSSKYKTFSLTNKEEVFPVTALAFYQLQSLLIMGDQFGNIEAWDLSDLLKKVAESKPAEVKLSFTKRKTNERSASNFLTEVVRANLGGEQDFPQQIIKPAFKIKKAHSDGITDIEMLEQHHVFATSSFDCCCFLWDVHTSKRVGALIIGGDKNWKLQISDTGRKAQAVSEARDILGKINQSEMSFPTEQDESSTKRKKMEFQSRKAASISNAKALIQKQRKLGLLSQDKSIVPQTQMRVDEDSSDDEYREEYESKEYHLLEDVIEFNKKTLGTTVPKASNLYKGEFKASKR